MGAEDTDDITSAERGKYRIALSMAISSVLTDRDLAYHGYRSLAMLYKRFNPEEETPDHTDITRGEILAIFLLHLQVFMLHW